MSFMYNPFPYDDPRPVNRPHIPAEVVESVVCGSLNSAKSLAARVESLRNANPGKSVILAFDGYATAEWQEMINLLSQQLAGKGILLEQKNYLDNLKEEEEINNMIDPLLEWDREKDPTLLYGKIFRGGYEALLDPDKTEAFRSELRKIREGNEGKVVVVYGNGCLIPANMQLFDLKLYFDVTPKESILRIRRGQYVNLGQKEARPANQIIRRCYYADFEMAVNLRRSLLRECALDYYVPSDKPGNLQLVPMSSLKEIFTSMASYPFRAKPVYLEGVWGGTYVKKLRNLPADMRNCAWVFDLIPMEVSIVVEVGRNKVEFPFQTFFMTASEEVMGKKCADKFGGYFPIRFNYDDSYHSTGNMSVQCHSNEKYNRENFDELGRQDESYYVVEAGHDAKTFIGFRDDADVDQFIKEIKIADKEYKPVDYMKYISYEESRPGLQVMIPAGTVHSSGRNQVVLEIGSLTIGSYTYKLYDYLRPDLDGIPRPIHTYHGERTVARDRTTTWVRNNIVQKPRIARSGEGWSEVIVGESPLLYFSLRRLEFEKEIEDNTNGKFHVLTLVDGEKIRIRSKQHPERYFDAEFMDMVVVPSTIGEYVVENLGVEPIRVHKTMLRMVSRMNDCQLLFDVGGTFLKAVIADSDRKLIEDAEYEVLMPSSGSRDEIIGALVTAVTRGAALAEERGMRIAGVAVDFPGPFDYNAGMSLMEHKFQSIRNVNLTDILKSHPALRSDVPVRFLHDVNAALAGEMMCGNARDFRNAALVTLGTGLGFACCIDSVLQLNPYGSPLISIFRIPYGGGILEDFVSKRGITRLYREMSGCVKNEITVAEIASAAFEGDDAARRAFAEAGGILGRVLAPILAENNIECLLCGGQISKSFELFGPALSENLKDVAQPRLIAPAKNITTAPFYGLLASLIQEPSR